MVGVTETTETTDATDMDDMTDWTGRLTWCSARRLWTMHWKVASLPTATVWLAMVSAKYGISSLWTSFALVSQTELIVKVSANVGSG